jgi:hypothetical protein
MPFDNITIELFGTNSLLLRLSVIQSVDYIFSSHHQKTHIKIVLDKRQATGSTHLAVAWDFESNTRAAS